MEHLTEYKKYTEKFTDLYYKFNELIYLCDNFDINRINKFLINIIEYEDFHIIDDEFGEFSNGYSDIKDYTKLSQKITNNDEYETMINYMINNIDNINEKYSKFKYKIQVFNNEYLKDIEELNPVIENFKNEYKIVISNLEEFLQRISEIYILINNKDKIADTIHGFQIDIMLISNKNIMYLCYNLLKKFYYKNLHVINKDTYEITNSDLKEFKNKLYKIYSNIHDNFIDKFNSKYKERFDIEFIKILKDDIEKFRAELKDIEDKAEIKLKERIKKEAEIKATENEKENEKITQIIINAKQKESETQMAKTEYENAISTVNSLRKAIYDLEGEGKHDMDDEENMMEDVDDDNITISPSIAQPISPSIAADIKELTTYNFPNVIQNKYRDANSNSHMEDTKFYENLLNLSGGQKNNTFFYLSNGANKELDESGEGTNAALSKINHKYIQYNNNQLNIGFFDVNKYKPIYHIGHLNTNTFVFNDKLQNNNNITLNNLINTNVFPHATKYTGATFYITFPNFKFYDFNIDGVYHLKGWGFNRVAESQLTPNIIENHENYKKLVTAYYIAILEHFFKNIKKNNDKNNISILHLCQVPGDQYGATLLTTNIFTNTIYGYIFHNRKKLDSSINKFRISIDDDKRNKLTEEEYNDYLYYQDIKNNEYLLNNQNDDDRDSHYGNETTSVIVTQKAQTAMQTAEMPQSVTAAMPPSEMQITSLDATTKNLKEKVILNDDTNGTNDTNKIIDPNLPLSSKGLPTKENLIESLGLKYKDGTIEKIFQRYIPDHIWERIKSLRGNNRYALKSEEKKNIIEGWNKKYIEYNTNLARWANERATKPDKVRKEEEAYDNKEKKNKDYWIKKNWQENYTNVAQTENYRKTTAYSHEPTDLTSESKHQEIRSIGEIPGYLLEWQYSLEIDAEKNPE
jgi:hypothetical protein